MTVGTLQHSALTVEFKTQVLGGLSFELSFWKHPSQDGSTVVIKRSILPATMLKWLRCCNYTQSALRGPNCKKRKISLTLWPHTWQPEPLIQGRIFVFMVTPPNSYLTIWMLLQISILMAQGTFFQSSLVQFLCACCCCVFRDDNLHRLVGSSGYLS